MMISIHQHQYWVERAGQGEPLVLLHGFTGSTSTWAPFVDNWSEHFEVICIDLPGHGKTNVNGEFSMESTCEDLHVLLKQLGYRKVHLLGYSLGGRAALSFACLYPNDVSSLILESSSPGLWTKEERVSRIQHDEALARRIENEGIESFVDFWANIPMFETQKRLSLKVQEQVRQERLNQTAKGLASSLRYMGTGAQPSWWDDLKQLHMPTLLLSGELDQKFTKLNQAMVDVIPNASHKVVKDAGHAIHVEKLQIFDKIVCDFILHNE
ncbi:2-succinyl-6-hydroxy-2,4-cyclohexadiene-1-carboxylate synthase [Salinibacillus xinjiangensis]|uniref:Putative 2-succinyl-6-hydroxy-2,4-cyclohexadiene-1-carboxylate synthase n=1 Tax=Salinibacillus xinjiangensis TaxID=1229268 RepID=A0A6G1X2T1_9BACI|nr:2-succinyl-6-hydroxy-2,4-cyclohexadiene-1-carboxylate synthase [Salinibacillus xinjiangensis]MRG85210.1 2-succinyl-6-hydroxy-2,4-cyclohexadiene-1-carboxylate synthase [Salinibacillus xinjiangensis]